MFTYQTRQWHWIDNSIVLLRLLWYVLNVIFIFVSTSSLEINKFWVTVFFAVSYIIPQLFHRPKKTLAFGYILSELVITGSLFVYITNFSANVIDILWIPILTIAFLSTKETKWMVIAGALIVPICVYFFGGFSLFLLLPYTIAIFLFGTMGLAFRFLLEKNEKQKLLLEELNIKNQQLIQLSDEIEYLTLKEERNRIAQELHDAIGHTFTATILGVDAIASLIDQEPAAAKEQAKVISSYAREGLEEIRKYVHALPLKEEIPIVFALRKVITSFNNTTGLNVSFDWDVEESQNLSKDYTILLVRSLQESLTNALKHGRATAISVTLNRGQELLTLTVEDNGQGKDNISLGFGLTTMKNRMEEIRGTFNIQSSKLGTTVELGLPL